MSVTVVLLREDMYCLFSGLLISYFSSIYFTAISLHLPLKKQKWKISNDLITEVEETQEQVVAQRGHDLPRPVTRLEAWDPDSYVLRIKFSLQIYGLYQGCQTYGPGAKIGSFRGWIRPAGWFCKVKTSLFA